MTGVAKVKAAAMTLPLQLSGKMFAACGLWLGGFMVATGTLTLLLARQ